ncbi:hypothetical protein BAUCODRAFT_143748 [Baudoinia panamericana UAMH 10762]|uniref:Rad60/SUMO-like domain-containing protein n=1 Tax=Baudoinia panamericana (strain UAMH 10762) TaxID=717646 RepID=M2LBT1_BAUPA|nr:uncharacterized protein BAUCODRAFT_143748 [Baudoinia panamericana UAMH 10762]EMC91342.1 hypothetical protein BAUCODRAFT_143748 [Baudoinia panamericana UAMH 10762]
MSLFDRPAWASTQSADDNDTSIFNHSSHSYAAIVADEQRRKRQRVEKHRAKQERKERKSSCKYDAEEVEPITKSEGMKRRRITLEEGEDLLDSVGMSLDKPKRYCGDDEVGESETGDISKRRSPRLHKVVNRDEARTIKLATPPQPAVVEIRDDDGKVKLSHVRTVCPDEEESDDDLAELARQARARKRLRDESVKKSETPEVRGPTPAQSGVDRNEAASLTPAPLTPPKADPTIKLFITSEIPNTKPLMVYRKLSQRLQEIREVWCKRQDFTPEMAAQVFLTYRLRKLFDVTTCKSLGLVVDAEGNVSMRGAEGVDGVDQVHLEVVTDEILARLKREKQREESTQPIDPEQKDDTGGGALQQQPTDKTQEYRILLKAKGAEPFKIKVKASTSILKIVTACRAHFDVQKPRSLHLDFDGEMLDPEQTVAETEVADMDCIDVHIG